MSKRGSRTRAAALSLLAVAALVLSACGPDEDEAPDAAAPSAAGSTTADPHAGQTAHSDDHAGVEPVKPRPLRPGERRMKLTMPTAYTPSAPTGVGTDDYRCFLLDPHLAKDTYLTGTHVLPGNPDVVHHVILFRVPPDQVAEAKEIDADEPRARAGPASAAPASTTSSRSTTRRGWAPGPRGQGVGACSPASASSWPRAPRS